MTSSRRALLRSLAGLPVLALAGCASGGVDYSTPGGADGTETPPTGTPESGGATATPSATATPAETDPATPSRTATPATDSALARDTEAVFDEIEWFATDYSVVVHRHLSMAGRIQDTLVKLRRSPALAESDLRRIEDATESYHQSLYDEVAPHFPTARVDRIVGQSRDRVATIRRFSERGDTDRVEEEVSRLATLYDRLSDRSVFERRFPDFPVGAPLIDYLTPAAYSASTPLVFVASYPAETYTTMVRAEASWSVRSRLASEVTDGDLRNFFARETALFRGVDTAAGRTGRVFLNVHLQRGRVRHSPVYLQRFEGDRQAAAALSSLVGSSVFVEEPVDIGRTTWERAYYYQEIPVAYPRNGYVVYDPDGNVVYDEDGDIDRDTDRTRTYAAGGDRRRNVEGDIVYGYLARAGRYLIAAAPSLTAWEERPDGAEAPLRRTWLSGTPGG
jgi:hypothetical protein